MSYASPLASTTAPGLNDTLDTNEVSRAGTASWKNIVEAVIAVNKVCVSAQDIGGAAVIENRELSRVTDLARVHRS